MVSNLLAEAGENSGGWNMKLLGSNYLPVDIELIQSIPIGL